MHGVPLVEASIPLDRDALTPAPVVSTEVPEGLSPTREDETPEPVEAVTIEIDSDTVKAEGPSRPTGPETDSSEPRQEQDPQTAPANPFGPGDISSDRRRNTAEPTLFPVENSTAPIKAGTTKAEYADWDALMNRIAKERIPVTKEFDDRGRVQYDVPSLDEDERMDLVEFLKTL